MKTLTLGLTAVASALLAGALISQRKDSNRGIGILPIITPFIDSRVADSFLIDLERNHDRPLVVVIHTFGGSVTPCAQIARALLTLETVSTVVPVRAYSGGTLIALSAETVAMGEFACMSAVDPILDERRARHFDQMKDSLDQLDAKEHFSAMMGLVDEIIARRKVPSEKLKAARTLLSGEKYPHGWPLNSVMLADAGITVERAAPFWSSSLERFLHEDFV